MSDNPYEAPVARLEEDAEGDRGAQLQRHRTVGMRVGLAFCVPFLVALAWPVYWALDEDRAADIPGILLMLLPISVLPAIGAWWGGRATGARASTLLLASALQGLLFLAAFFAAGQIILFMDRGRFTRLQGADFWQIPLIGIFMWAVCAVLALVVRHRLRRPS